MISNNELIDVLGGVAYIDGAAYDPRPFVLTTGDTPTQPHREFIHPHAVHHLPVNTVIVAPEYSGGQYHGSTLYRKTSYGWEISRID